MKSPCFWRGKTGEIVPRIARINAYDKYLIKLYFNERPTSDNHVSTNPNHSNIHQDRHPVANLLKKPFSEHMLDSLAHDSDSLALGSMAK